MSRIALLAFQFSPYPEVGANRWSGLVPALKNLGHEVSVVTVNWGQGQEFYKKEFPGVNVIVTSSGSAHRWKTKKWRNPYFNSLRNLVLRPLEKIFWFHDYAQRWKNGALTALEQIWQTQPFDVLIATGAPFHANVIAQEFKKNHPEVRLVQDLRDVWADNPYGWRGESLAHVQLFERQALSGADQVVTISEKLTQFYREKYPGLKINTVENGFDQQKFRPRASYSQKQPLVIVHAGNITNGREKSLISLLETIQASTRFQENFRLRLVGALPFSVRRIIRARYQQLLQNGVLTLKERVGRQQLLEELAQADLGLLLNSQELTYALSTKLYEYAALELPILSLHFGGEIEKFLSTVQWGHSVNLTSPTSLENALNRLLENPNSQALNFSAAVNFSFASLARKYSEVIGLHQ